jgi:hypothetical protein
MPAVSLAMLVAAASLALAGVFPLNNPDAFGHLAQGRNIAQLGHVPQRDPFSVWRPVPAPFHNYEWLSDLVMFGVWELGGPDALIIGKCALLALAGVLLVLVALEVGGPRAALAGGLLVLAAIPGARFRFSERPQIVAFPLAALYLLGLCRICAERTGRRERRIWIAALALAHVLWVNLHGSHLLGLALTALFLAFGSGARRALAILFALELAGSCVSPYGPAIVVDALEHVADPRYRALVREWGPWAPNDPLWLLLAPLLHSALLVLALRPLWRAGPRGRALLACAALLALASLRSVRFVGDYLLLSAPVIAWGLGERSRALPGRRYAAVCAAGLLALVGLVPWGAAQLPPRMGIALGQNLRGLPAASSHWLAAQLAQPRVLAAMDDAWFVLFGAPNARVVIDGRVPFYGPEHVLAVERMFGGEPALRALLERFAVNAVVLRHSFAAHARAHAAMRARDDWRLVAVEDEHSLFVRADQRLRDGSRPRALALEPGYQTDWLLRAGGEEARAILDELRRLPAHANTLGYSHWVRGMLALRELCRADCAAGLRAPADAAERALLARVQGWLARSARGTEGVPVVSAYLALVAADACALDAAEQALEDARREGESRETLLVAQEIALRRNQSEGVRAFVRQAHTLPGLADDPWLAALAQNLANPPRCP